MTLNFDPSEQLSKMLFDLHSHADIEFHRNHSQIVFTESAVQELLNTLANESLKQNK